MQRYPAASSECSENASAEVRRRDLMALAWGDFIPTLFCPQHFLTLTSREAVRSDVLLHRRYAYLVLAVNRVLFGNNFRRHGEGISYVYAVEAQRRGVPHIHAVWDQRYLPYALIHQIWNQIAGWAWIEPITADCGVGTYVVKHAVQDGEVFIYLARQIEALRSR